ncbi:DUF4421 domain-containing protein [Paludibacter sp. 221]|uniref:DUF4421 family protein n=1 Tax=Paludibacter sp. 221 TaxID=2302939 RepID=UPI0013D2BF34|nr:DUF4421 family protein [Paludibacter sp. 221]NDV45564.1 DUF4421 domain-containing protein [Paludibacter sp. 221]
MKPFLTRIIFTLLVITPLCSYSQTDSTYIKPFAQNFSLKVYASNKIASLLHENLLEENTYDPNRPPGIGVGFTLGKMGVSVSYGFDFLRDKEKGHTRSLDLQYHNYGRKIVFDLMGQYYEGFYNDNNQNNYETHPDLKTIKLGFFGQYIFNSSRFSYRAAFNQKERQVKSAGSFLLGGGIYYNEVHSDIPGFFSNPDCVKQVNFQIGPSAGYAYNWAITERYFISLSASAGFNLGFTNDQKFMIYPTAIPRFATGYNAESWSISLSYVNNLIYTYYTKSRKIALSSGGVQLTFVKRVGRTPAFLEKPAKKLRLL